MDVLLAYTPHLTGAALEHMKILDSRIYTMCGGLSHLPQRLYHVESPESFTALVNTVFQQFINQETRYIVLKGSVSAIWIIPLFTWLLPEAVCVTFKSWTVWGDGDGDARITVDLQEHGQEITHWKVEMWEATTIERLITIPFQESQSPQHIPWRITKQYIRAEFAFSDEVLSILGQMSGYLLNDLVNYSEICSGPFLRTKLNELISKEATSKKESVMRDCGWDDFDDEKIRALLEEHGPELDTDNYMVDFRESMKMYIDRTNTECIQEACVDPIERADLLHLAVSIATSALGSLMTESSGAEHGTECHPYTNFAAYMEREEIVTYLMSGDGMAFKEFREKLYSCIFYCLPASGGTDDLLVVEKDGFLLYPNIVFSGEAKKTSVFNFVIQPGAIRTESLQRCKNIREIVNRDYQSLGIHSEPIAVEAFSESDYIGLRPKTGWMARLPELLVYTSIRGDSIFIRPTLKIFPIDTVDMSLMPQSVPSTSFANQQALQRNDPPASPVEVRFRYLDVLENLVNALLVPRSPGFSVRDEFSLAQSYRTVLDRTVWLHPASATRSKWPNSIVAADSRFLVYTADSIGLTLFQLSRINQSVRTVIMEKGCNLVQAIHAAEEAKKGKWVIIVSG